MRPCQGNGRQHTVLDPMSINPIGNKQNGMISIILYVLLLYIGLHYIMYIMSSPT